MYAAILGQQELLKGDFNWAATGHFFSEGVGGGCKHSGYHTEEGLDGGI